MAFPTIEALKPQGKKTIELMAARGMRIRAINIVYYEGIDTDLKTVNADRLDEWNDVRCLITDDGDVLLAAKATTEPGREYTYDPMNPGGAFRIALNTQFRDAWCFGKHYDQNALVQCGEITGHRDFNEDGFRTGDKVVKGSGYGVNQHTTRRNPTRVGKWSAGCLVGRSEELHDLFLDILRASGRTVFDTVVFDGKLLLT